MAERGNGGLSGDVVDRNQSGPRRNNGDGRCAGGKPQVYFIACDDLIKIGFSRFVERRIRALETAGPSELIGVINGGTALERALHRHFWKHHQYREWFKDCAELRDGIRAVLAFGPDMAGVVVGTSATSRPAKDGAWFYEAAQVLLGKDAGLHLHNITGHPKSCCYAYTAHDASKRRSPPEHFLRALFYSDYGEAWHAAFMRGCEAKWWIKRHGG